MLIKSVFNKKQNRIRNWLDATSNHCDDEGIDERFLKPRIKTLSSNRQIPLSETVAGIIQIFAEIIVGRKTMLISSIQNGTDRLFLFDFSFGSKWSKTSRTSSLIAVKTI